jgi:hypothetical protein
MDSFRALNRRNLCHADGKRWIFVFVLGFVFILGLAILISSITYLHNNDEDGNTQESTVPSHQALKLSESKDVETKKVFQSKFIILFHEYLGSSVKQPPPDG